MKKIILLLTLFMPMIIVNATTTLNSVSYKLPSFANSTKILGINSSKKIKDENNVLSNYVIKESEIEATIIDNELKITTDKEGTYTITFIEKSQELEEIKFSVTIKVVSGSIKVSVVDSEKKDRLEATLNNFSVDIYKGNSGYAFLKTDNNAEAFKNNLMFGEYKVKSNSAPKGYKKDVKEENVYIWEGSYDINVILYYEVIKGNLIINKYCDNVIDEDSVFEVYHNNKLIAEVIGNNPVELEYGSYLIKQKGGKKYYTYVDDFFVDIKEDKDYIFELNTSMDEGLKDTLNTKEIELSKKEDELNNLEKELLIKSEKLIEKEKELELLKSELIVEKENIKDNYNQILAKKQKLKELEFNLNTLKDTLDKREEKIKNYCVNNNLSEEDVLIVEVPDTHKYNYTKLISLILIFIGFILIIINFIYKKKTTQ